MLIQPKQQLPASVKNEVADAVVMMCATDVRYAGLRICRLLFHQIKQPIQCCTQKMLLKSNSFECFQSYSLSAFCVNSFVYNSLKVKQSQHRSLVYNVSLNS